MKPGFYENRDYLDREFEHPKWNKQSGQDAKTLSINLKNYIDEHLDLPMPLLRAKAFEYTLANAQIEINPQNIFADKINIGVNYDKYAGQDLFAENMYARFNEEVQDREIPVERRRNKQATRIGIGTAWADYWHTLPDWNEVLRLGFSGLLDRAKTLRDSKATAGQLTPEQAVYFDSVIISYQAILHYIHRLYEESLLYDIPQYSQCLHEIAAHPPETLYQVLETVCLFLTVEEIGVERGRSLGIIDHLYYPYYIADIRSGRYTVEEIREMFRYLFNRFNAAKRFAAQPFTLDGTIPDGANAENELTHLILDAYEELGNVNPKIHIRYREDSSDELMDRIMGLIRKGLSSIAIINDEAGKAFISPNFIPIK